MFRLTKLTATMNPSVPRTRIGGKSRPGSLTLCIVIELVSPTVGKYARQNTSITQKTPENVVTWVTRYRSAAETM